MHIPKKNRRLVRHLLWVALCLAVSILSQNALAEPFNQNVFARRTEMAYHSAKADYLRATNGSPAAWIFARACYNLADLASTDDERAGLAKEGIDACQKLLLAQPKSGAAYYYLGMNEGQLARTKLLGALKLVREMEQAFKTAWSLDKTVDHGGPARSLGLLYRDAPGWPTSIGNKRKAHDWLERVVQFDPIFPENFMVLGESDLRWDEVNAAAEALKKLDANWAQAQTQLTGIAWEADWADWNHRREVLRTQIKEKLTTASNPTNSSRR